MSEAVYLACEKIAELVDKNNGHYHSAIVAWAGSGGFDPFTFQQKTIEKFVAFVLKQDLQSDASQVQKVVSKVVSEFTLEETLAAWEYCQ